MSHHKSSLSLSTSIYHAKPSPYPAGSGLNPREKKNLALAGVVTLIAIILLIVVGVAISGPVLWGLAPTSGCLLAGKGITAITLAATGVLTLALPPAVCLSIFCRCCAWCYNCN